MAKARNNNGRLEYNAVLNYDSIEKGKKAILQTFDDIAKRAAGMGLNLSKGFDPKAMTGYQSALASMKQSLANSQQESERLRQNGIQLRNEYAKGQLTIQEYKLELAKLALQRKQEIEGQRQARKAAQDVAGSYEEAKKKLNALSDEIRRFDNGMNQSTPELEAKIKQFRELSSSIGDFDARMGRSTGNNNYLQSGLSGLKEMALAFVAGGALLNGAKQFVAINAEISDSLSSVQRTAGQTASEADRLVGSLKLIDTRTNLKGLVDIATIGGQLGIAKDELSGFTRAIDQLGVTLSGEIPGGAEEVATALGKINGVFKVQQNEGTNTEQSLNKTGSAILALGQAGLATGAYLQDFTLRVAGTAQTAKIALPTILAYSALMEETGSSAEVAGTAFNKLVGSLALKKDKFFAIAQLGDAKLTLEQFTNLINNDTNKALDTFFKGLNSGNPTFEEFQKRVDTVGVKAGPAKNAIIALAQNQDLLNERISQGTKAYNDGTLAAEQFAIKNNNLAAALEKVKNFLYNIFQSSEQSGRLAGLINSFFDTRTEAERMSAEFKTNKQRLDDLNNSVRPLTARYDELKRQGKLTTGEQAELRDVTQQLATLLPGITTKFDQFGNSLEINRTKISELTKAQREYLELQNRGAIQAAQEQFNQAQKYLPAAQKMAAELQKSQRTFGDKIYDAIYGGDRDAKSKQASIDRITRLSATSYEAAKAIRDLGGVLTSAQQKVIDYYEALDKKPGKKTTPVVPITPDGTDTEIGRTIDDIKSDIKRITELKQPLDTASAQYKLYVKQLQDLRKELKLANGTPVSGGSGEGEVSARNALQKRIDEINNNARRKQLSSDEQEVQAVRDKYAAIRKEIEIHNAKVKSPGNRTNSAGLVTNEANEIKALEYRQETTRLKTFIDDQKKIYDDFEAYKSKFGLEEAKKRFAKEFDVEVSYMETLQMRRAIIAAKGEANLSDVERERLKDIDSRIEAEVDAQKKKYDALMADVLNYEQIRLVTVQKYQEARAKAVADGDAQAVANLDRVAKENIAKLDDEHIQKLNNFKDLFDGVDKLSEAALKKVAGNGKELLQRMLDEGIGSPELRKKIKEAIDNLTKSSTEKLPAGLRAAASELQSLASIVGDIDSGFGNWIGTLANVVGNISNIKSQIGEMKKGFSAGGDPISAVAAGIGFFNSIISIGKTIGNFLAQGAKTQLEQQKYSADLQSKQNDAMIKALDRQLSLINQIYGTEKITKYVDALKSIEEVSGGIGAKISGMYQITGIKQIDDLIEKFNNGTLENKGFERAMFNGFVDKGLLTKVGTNDVDALQKLLDGGKLDAATTKLAESFIELKQKATDAANSIKEALTGTSFESFADGIVDLFAQGNAEAADFGKNLEDIMKKAILNSFKTKTLATELQKYYDDFAGFAKSDNVLTEAEISTLKDQYDKIIKDGQAKFKDLEKVTGVNFANSGNNNNSLTGAFKSATQESIDLLAGNFGAMRIAQIEMRNEIIKQTSLFGQNYTLAMNHFAETQAIRISNQKIADNTEHLKDIKAGIQSLDRKSGGSSYNPQMSAGGLKL